MPDQAQVQRQQGTDQDRHHHDVDGVEPGDHPLSRVFTPEDEEGKPLTDERDGQGKRVGHPQTCPRESVVGQGIPGEPVGYGEDQERDTHDPVDISRLAEGAREEHST